MLVINMLYISFQLLVESGF